MKLSEEEEKAIEYLKEQIKVNRSYIKRLEELEEPTGYGTRHDTCKLHICNYQIILNLIEKLQKEREKDRVAIKELEERENKLDEGMLMFIDYLLTNQQKNLPVTEYLVRNQRFRIEQEKEKRNKEIEEYLRAELKKESKIIDLMAEKLNQAYFEEYKFQKWFEKMSGIQKKMDYGYLVDKIKEHFRKKVENEI